MFNVPQDVLVFLVKWLLKSSKLAYPSCHVASLLCERGKCYHPGRMGTSHLWASQVLGKFNKELDKKRRSSKQSIDLLQMEIYSHRGWEWAWAGKLKAPFSCWYHNLRPSRGWGREWKEAEKGIPLMSDSFDWQEDVLYLIFDFFSWRILL
jgi:hypothetical protein